LNDNEILFRELVLQDLSLGAIREIMSQRELELPVEGEVALVSRIIQIRREEDHE